METEKDRIEKIMETENLNATQFAAEIGIKSPTLSHILNGRNNPSLDVLKRILDRYRTISSDWLILGVGPMYRGIKQAQMPSLFDDEVETSSKSGTYVDKRADIPGQEKNIKEENLEKNSDELLIADAKSQIPSRQVKKIIVYYDDNTFQEMIPLS